LIVLGLLLLTAAIWIVPDRDALSVALVGAGVALVALGPLLYRARRIKLPGGFEAEIRDLRETTNKLKGTTEELKDSTEEISDTVGRMDLFWENLRANAEVSLRQSGVEGVRLRGGPMDGWLVSQNAPALQPDWYKTWPPTVAARHRSGQYEVSDSGTWAEWKATKGGNDK
jgi:hypothetical protein